MQWETANRDYFQTIEIVPRKLFEISFSAERHLFIENLMKQHSNRSVSSVLINCKTNKSAASWSQYILEGACERRWPRAGCHSEVETINYLRWSSGPSGSISWPSPQSSLKNTAAAAANDEVWWWRAPHGVHSAPESHPSLRSRVEIVVPRGHFIGRRHRWLAGCSSDGVGLIFLPGSSLSSAPSLQHPVKPVPRFNQINNMTHGRIQ